MRARCAAIIDMDVVTKIAMRSVSHKVKTDNAGGMVNSHSALRTSAPLENVTRARQTINISKRLKLKKVGETRHGFARFDFARMLAALRWVALLCCFANVSLAQTATTPPGTLISNTAMLQFARPSGGMDQAFSNSISVTVEPAPTRSMLALFRATDNASASMQSVAGPTTCRAGGGSSPMPAPTLIGGVTANPLQFIPMAQADVVHGGEALFVQVVDGDQNRNAAAIDTLDVTLGSAIGDSETIRLSETGVDTGVFVGYIPTRAGAAVSGDCVLEVDRNSQVTSSYADPGNAQDRSSATAMVDPYGLVFDSQTGQAVNGTVVRLINAATGQAATVFGDDGVSRYPSTMTTGGQVTDAGGTVYSLPPGVFRFPIVAAGQYRLEIQPPLDHAFPSQHTIADLNLLPGGPFHLQAGSFGQDFAVTGPAAVAIDVPVDLADAQLFLQKSTITTTAALGDFVQYTLSVENTGNLGTFHGVTIRDQLPRGVHYRNGSTRINNGTANAVAVDPAIASDGRTLSFSIATLPPHTRVAMTYVVEITQSARGPELTNTAQATSLNGARSNGAQATIRLRDDFFRDTAVVMGRVVEGTCAKEVKDLPGVAGVRVYLEDGRYSVTDDEGKYHFEGVKPGSHVVQIDNVSIPAELEFAACDKNVRHSGRAYSQFIDVRGGALWRSDFVLAKRKPPEGNVALSMTSTLSGDLEINHVTTVKAERNDIDNARLLVMLPEGLSYVPGSARTPTGIAIEPTAQGNLLTFKLGAIAANNASGVIFKSQAALDAAGALPIKAYLMFEGHDEQGKTRNQATTAVENRALRGEMTLEKSTYRLNPRFDATNIELKSEDRAQLDRLAKEWEGVRNLHVALAGAHAMVVADYLRTRLALTSEQLNVAAQGVDESPDADSATRARSIEIAIEGMRVHSLGRLSIVGARGAAAPVKTLGVVAGRQIVATNSTNKNSKSDTDQKAKREPFDVETLTPGIAWLMPQAGDIPAIASVKVAIEHGADQTVELLINDKAVSALNFDGTSNNKDNTVFVSHWLGIDLQDGDNHLVAVIRDKDSNEVSRLTRDVRFSGGAVRAEFVKEQSTLTADGKSHPIIALRMFDASGNPARPGTLGAYRVEAPYRSWWEVQTLHENQLLIVGQREPTFRVDDDGLARIELEPSTQTGTVKLQLRFNERQTQDLHVWLTPEAREWVLVGLAEGSSAYRTIKDNLQNAADAGLQEGYEKDGRVAFFAKGRVKGEYLLTVAYDSAREKQVKEPRLLGVIEPDRYYTVYGDGAEQRFEAASQEKLYLKLERQQFMAMFGDFETGLTVTELSRYSRTLTGFKSDYAGERFSYSAFAAQTDQGFVKDELLGDGTSGLYRLSQGQLIANSDKVRIEVRDRFRSEVVVESRVLARYIDYSIDYFNGTLFFKQPVASRDANFNPVFIIAEYEVLQGGKEQVVTGGRGAMKFAGDRVEVGASYMQEGANIGDTRLAGTDIKVQVTKGTTVHAEVARSQSDNPLRASDANAYLTEIKHVSERVDATAYFRNQDAQFGFGQQLSTETGTRKTGVDGRVKLTDTLALRAEAYDQKVTAASPLASDAERQMASAELRQETARYGLGLGVRHVSDSGLTGSSGGAQTMTSDLANVNGALRLLGDRVVLKAAQDLSLGSSAQSVDFPARSVLGVDYKLTQATTVFSEYEHSEGANIKTDMTRVGMRTTPWAHAQMSSSVNQQYSEYGPRVFSNLGLLQGWQINKSWVMDFGLDQNKTVSGSNVQPLNRNVPLASGSLTEDFLATSVAAAYRGEAWTFNSRVEHRNSDQEQRWTYIGGFYREAQEGHAFSLATQYLTSDANVRGDTTSALIRMGWAYRPVTSEWIVLDRLDLKKDSRNDSLTQYESSRLINNFNANWQMNARTQAGLQLGARYVVSTFDNERYTGMSSLIGFDMRRDLSSHFDIGAHATTVNSWNAGTSDVALGFDVGITVARNVWLSVGYNMQGFRDNDFEASRYTAQGPFIKLRVKADQDTFKDLSTAFLRPSKKNEAN